MTDSLALATGGIGYGSLAIATDGFWGVEVANQTWYPPELLLSLGSAGTLLLSLTDSSPGAAGPVLSAHPSMVAFPVLPGEVSAIAPVAVGVGSELSLGRQSVDLATTLPGVLTMWETEPGDVGQVASGTIVELTQQSPGASLEITSPGNIGLEIS